MHNLRRFSRKNRLCTKSTTRENYTPSAITWPRKDYRPAKVQAQEEEGEEEEEVVVVDDSDGDDEDNDEEDK